VLDPEPRREPATGPRSRAEALSIARLFDHMEPQLDATGPAYRRDAYEEAPTITHRAAPPARLSAGTRGALFAGGALSLMIVFVAGFLSAVLMLGEHNPDGEIAIRTAPLPPVAADAASPPVPAEPQRELVPSANAGRTGQDPAPAPEIAAAEQARDTAIAPPAITPPAPPPEAVPDAAPETPSTAAALPEARVATDSFVYPPGKPAAPARAQAAAADTQAPALQTGIGPPGGNYSLQFGAFRDRANAEALLRELRGVAQAGVAEEAGATGRTLFFVRAGAFRTRAEALQAVEALRRESGHVTFVHANTGTG
jgi:cell division septation protein DedD